MRPNVDLYMFQEWRHRALALPNIVTSEKKPFVLFSPPYYHPQPLGVKSMDFRDKRPESEPHSVTCCDPNSPSLSPQPPSVFSLVVEKLIQQNGQCGLESHLASPASLHHTPGSPTSQHGEVVGGTWGDAQKAPGTEPSTRISTYVSAPPFMESSHQRDLASHLG